MVNDRDTQPFRESGVGRVSSKFVTADDLISESA